MMLRSLHLVILESIKLILSAIVGVALVYPFLLPEPTGLAKELAFLGGYGSATIGLLFFSLVALYAFDLRSILVLVSPNSRISKPNSVWWMVVLPYNFIEDFFIINAITKSLRREALGNKKLENLKSFGELSGFGWCIAQIGSLILNQIGSFFALVALIMWAVHWNVIRKAKAALHAA